ncbi:head-tail connector protein [Janthinobacterium aquaticum]|uniref:head-tail connector protein n=1 Tax=Janthinobacterium sp. FT58W TaxID=2654254 RepID=UPI0012650598|nr:hypothetical protein [Janthinobacterium sp. FT58W]KAB8042557.1 hypothetical protein GCM43_13615 [Janthinobacterium sp. FT58W]
MAICITPPSVLAVDLDMIKKNMVIDGDHMDDVVKGWATGVISKLEHELDQCLMAQTWRVTLDAFAPEIALPHPVLDIVSVKYFDPDGAEHLLPASGYRVRASRYASALVPGRGARWPATLDDTDVVTIDVQCGYGTTSEATPDNVRLYILAKLVEQFDPITRTERDTVQSAFIDRLLDACKGYA